MLRNVTNSQKVLYYFNILRHSPDKLLTTKLEPGKEYEIVYDLQMPEEILPGVYIHKFCFIDPFNSENYKLQSIEQIDSRYGEVLTVTILVQENQRGKHLLKSEIKK